MTFLNFPITGLPPLCLCGTSLWAGNKHCFSDAKAYTAL
ncbi:hypothetical protein BAQU_0224 [Bifidobacterium aquikefiri]|uniref:Uncharacterized protein n=1 Tax=Bifidobacterium aquikefiri TaxID=1653207 RepID=A0A261GAF0_9BIFI|nr:hypothetical protein BAQU_0224 [Bifidobacterium aquikefiri]